MVQIILQSSQRGRNREGTTEKEHVTRNWKVVCIRFTSAAMIKHHDNSSIREGGSFWLTVPGEYNPWWWKRHRGRNMRHLS